MNDKEFLLSRCHCLASDFLKNIQELKVVVKYPIFILLLEKLFNNFYSYCVQKCYCSERFDTIEHYSVLTDVSEVLKKLIFRSYEAVNLL